MIIQIKNKQDQKLINFFVKYRYVFDPRLKLMRKIGIIIDLYIKTKKIPEGDLLILKEIYSSYKDKIIKSHEEQHFLNPDTFQQKLLWTF